MAEATIQALPPKPKIRRITEQDVQEIAKLVSKRITEKGACLMLGIRPESWFNFKLRAKNSKKFEDSLTRTRESKLNAIISTIDEAGDSQTIIKDGKVIQRPGDWRAKAWLAERVLAPDRFGQQPEQVQQPTISISIVTEALKRVYGGEVRQIGEEKKLLVHPVNTPVIDTKPQE